LHINPHRKEFCTINDRFAQKIYIDQFNEIVGNYHLQALISLRASKSATAVKKMSELKDFNFYDELVDMNFHDSTIIDCVNSEGVYTIVIEIDTYWYPGKPIGILKLSNVTGFKKFDKMRKEQINQIDELLIDKKGSKYEVHGDFCVSEYNNTTIHPEGSGFMITCDSFSFERVDNYKSYEFLFKIYKREIS
jgi:hypothetical protein